jgi:hypothetical protein
MTKLRTPDSIEDACTQAKALLGSDAISTALSAVGLAASTSLIDKWCDADAAQQPSLRQALTMESLLIKTGHAPIFSELFARLRPGTPFGVPLEPPPDPVQAAMQATIDAAEMLKGVRDAVQDGALQPHEVAGLKARLTKMQRALGALNRSLVVKRR